MRQTPLVPLTPTWQNLLEQYRDTYLASRNLSLASRREYICDIHQLLAFLCSKDIGNPVDTSLDSLNQFLAHLDEKGLSGLSRRRKTSSIKSFFSYLEQNGTITKNVALRLIPPKRELHLPRFLTEEEFKNLQLVASGSVRDNAIIQLLLQTGIRLSELTHLTIDDVKLPTKITEETESIGTLYVRLGKGRRDRMLTLNHKVNRALRNWLRIRPSANTNALFTSKFKRPITQSGYQWLVQEYFQKSGIKNASIHSLRHTFGTHFVKKGTNLRVVQEMMGHSSLQTTSLYISLARDLMDKQIQENAL